MTVGMEFGFLHLNEANAGPLFSPDGLSFLPDGCLSLDDPRLDPGLARGAFLAGPIEVGERATRWHRLRVTADPLPVGSHVQLFTWTTESDDTPNFFPDQAEPFPEQAPDQGSWRALPRDAFDVLIPNEPARYLWIGGVLRRGDRESPCFRQIRVDYGREGYLKHLPALYGREPAQAGFLDRKLALDESELGRLGDAIDDLPRLFDPQAAPASGFPSWLSWLGGWQTFELSELWQEEDTRRYLGEAFDLHGKRGTVEGLRRYLKIYAGVEAHIVEPALHAHLWSLGETSTLGFTTMLAPAHLQGAVVGTTATLDQSHLTQGDALGEALLDDLAHHFCVHVYCAELTRPGALDDVRAVLEREKPAHSTYELCVIEPQLRVGSQARVGIDAIVGQGPPVAKLAVTLNMETLATVAQPCSPNEENSNVES